MVRRRTDGPPRVLRAVCGALAIAGLSLGAPSLQAQAITGTLVEEGTGAPVDGAAVVLLDASEEPISWRLTDPVGRFSFVLGRGGTFRLRADRIGHGSVRSDLIEVGRGQTVSHRLEIPVEAVVLEGLTVESGRRCRVRPGSDEATARVWEEARKALTATAETARRGFYRYVIRRFERELDARGRRVLKEESRVDRRLTPNPWKSLPVDDLLNGGFVRTSGEGSTYFAPDADVLLSDSFLDTHCMRLEEGEDESEGLVGLVFEPVDDRGVPDISGTLWIDPASGELQWLDYRYEELDVPHADRLGGRVSFEGLPNGTWIVREWSIRMPMLAVTRRRPGVPSRTELTGIKEDGGLVVRVSNVGGEVVLDSRAGILEGVVVDSLGRSPVAGAIVLLDGTDRATTDEEGRFRFPSLPRGHYGLRVFNPALEIHELPSPTTYLESIPGQVSSVRLEFPGVVSALEGICGPHEPREGGGILTGAVRTASGEPAVGATISIRWDEVRALITGFQRQDFEGRFEVRQPTGLYAVCALPRDRWLWISVTWNGEQSPPERWRFPAMAVVAEKDLTVPSEGASAPRP